MAFVKKTTPDCGLVISKEQGTELKQFIYDSTKECVDNNPLLYNRNTLTSTAIMRICWTRNGVQVCKTQKIYGINFVEIYRSKKLCDADPQSVACEINAKQVKEYQRRLTAAYRRLKRYVPPDATDIKIDVSTICQQKGAPGIIGGGTSPPQDLHQPLLPGIIPDIGIIRIA